MKRYVKAHDAAGHVTVAMIDHQYHGSWILDAAVCERVVAGIERMWAAAAGQGEEGEEEGGEQQLLSEERRGRRSSSFLRLRKGLASMLVRRRSGAGSMLGGKGYGVPETEGAAAVVAF